MSNSIIEIKDLSKKFGKFTAVNSVNFAIKEGELFGLLGPNGAGKTTTISMLSTILKPTSGNATINGNDLKHQDAIRRSIGVVFQDPSLDDELTAKENLEFHGRMYHMPVELRKKRIGEVLKLVNLDDKASSKVKTFSGGMKRRLEIARGLMHHPKVLFLDEPTLGLDPQTRRSIWDYVKKLNEEEKLTIILTTHYMEEADFLCNRIAIIDHGKIIALDTPDALKNIMGGDVITLETPDAEELKKILKFKWIKSMKTHDDKLSITVKNGEKVIAKIIGVVCNKKMQISSVSLKKPTLEDVFLHYTGKTIREQEASSIDEMRARFKRGMRR
ncbi:MAG: ATP-binding cassette domain-containing protein [Candidatus Aenigmarchaeota archaeon]|nr:ATP-binding cassette domain-containing protein [Candidatus Aenigmarchaeota archaeon]